MKSKANTLIWRSMFRREIIKDTWIPGSPGLEHGRRNHLCEHQGDFLAKRRRIASAGSQVEALQILGLMIGPS